jgi:hypothetical protein
VGGIVVGFVERLDEGHLRKTTANGKKEKNPY